MASRTQSLWSVNNVFSTTALIYTSIIVALSTYIIVFHLDNLVYHTSSAYTPMRDKIISRMKNDSHEHWTTKGKQFATFQPKHERLRPSEWWVLLFSVKTLFTSLYRFLLRKPKPANGDPETCPKVIVVSSEDGAISRKANAGTHNKEEISFTAAAVTPSSDSYQPPAWEL